MMDDERLLWAAQAGRERDVATSLGNGANPNAKGNGSRGQWALELALGGGTPLCARLLLAAGADKDALGMDGAPIAFAAMRQNEQGSEDRLSAMLAAGVDPETRSPRGETLLMAAVRAGSMGCVQALVRFGAAVDSKSAETETALSLASVAQLEMVQFLLGAGADPNGRNCYGSAPLHSAVASKSIPIARALIDAGADPTTRDKSGRSLLSLAADGTDERMVDLLLTAGAAGSAAADADEDGRTPLMRAALRGSAACAHLLISAGADPAACDHAGRTAADFARMGRREDLASLLGALWEARRLDRAIGKGAQAASPRL